MLPHDKKTSLLSPQSTDLPKQDIDDWEIDRQQIRLVRRLREGMNGVVWEGLWNNTTPVAVKTLKLLTRSTCNFLQEATMMMRLHHLKVVQLYAVCTKEVPVYIVMELMKHGNLLDYLRGEGRSLKLPQLIDISAQVASGMSFLVEQNVVHRDLSTRSVLKLPQLIDISAQVASGMSYLEEQNVVHRDLSARSVLVGDHMICKVSNFEQARLLEDDIYESPEGFKFPIKWTAPEALLNNRFVIKSDVWSFGIVLWEIITYGRFPYPGMTNTEVLEKIQTGYRMGYPPNCPKKLHNIMMDCWREDPDSRPTFKSLKVQLEDFFTADTRSPKVGDV